ncbi:hypothetical protein BDP67DRAFT_438301 [Colletotrichum lupini]|nr:hypothetical protein BDP67DRAFT_438301 [Colletotrichum lupini]
MEAAGLASSILTFIDICYKVAKRTYEIYESATGATAENIHVGNVIIDLEKAAAELSPVSRGHDAELAKLSEQCRTLSDDLLKLLAGLERREKRLFQSFKAAIAGARKQKEVASIEKRLDQYRQQIILHLTLNIYRDQSPIKAQLERIRDDSSRLENEHAAKLDALHNQLSEVLERMRTASSRPFWDQQVSNDHLARLLHDFKSCASTLEAENKTLDSLYFDAIFQRENSVSDAVSNTFAWILLEETQNREAMSQSLHSFLADEGEVFFVCGKAGSGKSTLMKFLSHHSSVRETLVDCASKRKLVIVNTFFWSSGDPLQKSLEGFYRAVLFHTLRQCPELLETVIPTLTGICFSPLSAAISLSELEAAFSRLQSLENAASYLFCYFIDGLDEYEGDPLDQKHLAEMLRKWSRKDNVKIICSARPSTVTLDIFGASKTFFELHKLTKADIHAFAEDQIEKYLSEPTFKKVQAVCLGMIHKIVERADGVFLWASLVVRALLNAALEHEDEFSIQKRLEECPKSLNQLFHQMLDSIDPSPSVRLRSTILLQLLASEPRIRLNALALSWLDESRTLRSLMGLPRRSNHDKYTETRIETEHRKARSQLHTLTRGLVEMEASEQLAYLTSTKHGCGSYYQTYFCFFHRTVRDFLAEEWLPSLVQRPLITAEQEAAVKAELLIAEIRHCPEPHLHLSEHAYPGCYFKMLDFFDSFRFSPIQRLDFFTVLVQELAVVVCGNQQHSPPFLSQNILIPKSKQQEKMGPTVWEPFSFLHFAATYGMAQYVKTTVASMDNPTIVDTSNVNLLITAAYSFVPALVDFLLQEGWHPNELVTACGLKSSLKGERCFVSVWEAFLYRVASFLSAFCADESRTPVWKVRNRESVELLNDMFSMVESFLQSGAVSIPIIG